MMHCAPCLDGGHKRCRVMLPLEWGDDLGRCICKCIDRDSTRLCNVERINGPIAPKKRGRKPGAAKWTDDKLRELCELERQGLTSRQIGEKVGAHMDVVRTYLSKARSKGMR